MLWVRLSMSRLTAPIRCMRDGGQDIGGAIRGRRAATCSSVSGRRPNARRGDKAPPLNLLLPMAGGKDVRTLLSAMSRDHQRNDASCLSRLQGGAPIKAAAPRTAAKIAARPVALMVPLRTVAARADRARRPIDLHGSDQQAGIHSVHLAVSAHRSATAGASDHRKGIRPRASSRRRPQAGPRPSRHMLSTDGAAG